MSGRQPVWIVHSGSDSFSSWGGMLTFKAFGVWEVGELACQLVALLLASSCRWPIWKLSGLRSHCGVGSELQHAGDKGQGWDSVRDSWQMSVLSTAPQSLRWSGLQGGSAPQELASSPTGISQVHLRAAASLFAVYRCLGFRWTNCPLFNTNSWRPESQLVWWMLSTFLSYSYF